MKYERLSGKVDEAGEDSTDGSGHEDKAKPRRLRIFRKGKRLQKALGDLMKRGAENDNVGKVGEASAGDTLNREHSGDDSIGQKQRKNLAVAKR